MPEKVSTELEQVPEPSTIYPQQQHGKAIFAPQYDTYYFYSPVTQETICTSTISIGSAYFDINPQSVPHVNKVIYQNKKVLNECVISISMLRNWKEDLA